MWWRRDGCGVRPEVADGFAPSRWRWAATIANPHAVRVIGTLGNVSPTGLERADCSLVRGEAAHDATAGGACHGAVAVARDVTWPIAGTGHAAPVPHVDDARSVARAAHVAILVTREVALAIAAAVEITIATHTFDRAALCIRAHAIVSIALASTLTVRVLLVTAGHPDEKTEQGRHEAENHGPKVVHDVSILTRRAPRKPR
jgi:hypothetical protein